MRPIAATLALAVAAGPSPGRADEALPPPATAPAEREAPAGAAPGAPEPATARPPAPRAAPAAADDLEEEITVVAPSRLPRLRDHGDGVSVTTVDRRDLRRSGARVVQDALSPLPGFHLADEQGTPLQQDLSMRGLTASPVTGLSQGISVFLDGVRVNEPGAEEVNFDLLPLADVEHVEIVRGPRAIYGRNALGGAIHLVTRRGGSTPAAEVEVEAGSWLHQRAQAQAAGPLGPLDARLSIVEGSAEGWRDAQSARGVQLFGKVGLLRGGTDAGLSYQYQRDRLEQPGSLPIAMLQEDRTQNYTAGDFFAPELHLVTLNARQELGTSLSLSVNAYLRALDAEQFNASFQAADSRMRNRTRTWGGAAQVEQRGRLGRAEHQLTVGLEATLSDVAVTVTEEANASVGTHEHEGALLPLPQVVGDLADEQLGLGAFLQEHVRLADGPLAGLGATAALRYDRLSHDVLDTSPLTPHAADGRATYERWVPAVAVSWTARRWSASASWSEGFRAPAFLELTCADPEAPCVGLQAGVAPDATFTALRPVRSRSIEAGLRAAPLAALAVTLDAFRIDLHDEIYGVTGADTTQVWFQNVGDTRREGLELAVEVRRGPLELEASWAYTRATFQDDFTISTPRVPGGTEDVHRGDRLPLVPEQLLDAEARVRPVRWLALSAGVRHVGSQWLRGDEANLAPKLAAYDVVRAGAEVRAGRWTASLRATNLLGARYETFGTYNVDGRNPGAGITPFLTPGPPLRLVLAMRWEIG